MPLAPTTRTEIAHLFRTYRRAAREHRALARGLAHTYPQVDRTMAQYYEAKLDGARELLAALYEHEPRHGGVGHS